MESLRFQAYVIAMAELKRVGNYFCVKVPTVVYSWEKPFWVKPTETIGPINLSKYSVEYKIKYIQKECVVGFEQFDAKHTLTLCCAGGKDIEIQFENEEAYKNGVTALEQELLY
jgi:hypothetical protein